MKKLLTKENLEVLIIDGLTMIGLFLIGEINLPIAIYTPIALLTICYAMAKKTPPKNVMVLLFAFSLIGIVFSISGLLFLLYDNSFMAALAGIILGFIFAMSKENSKGQISTALNKLYDHKSRIFLLPISFNLFILGAQSIFTYQISPSYAMVFMIATYVPVRLMFLFKPKAKWYHFFIMLAAGYFYVNEMSTKINNSPTTPVWFGIKNELGDRLKIIDTDSIDEIIVEATIEQERTALYKVSRGTYYFVVDIDSTNRWNIVWDKTDTLNIQKGMFKSSYKKFERAVKNNMEYY